MDESAAIAVLQGGDIGGLEALVRAHQLTAVRVATLITRDRAVAEEIVQSAFLRVYERRHQFDAAPLPTLVHDRGGPRRHEGGPPSGTRRAAVGGRGDRGDPLTTAGPYGPSR